MKKKLALLMAAIMTVAMVPMTAFAATSGSTSISADNMRVAVESAFQSNVELYKKSSASSQADKDFVVKITLENGTFAKFGKDWNGDTSDKKDDYVNEFDDWATADADTQAVYTGAGADAIKEFDVTGSKTAVVTIDYTKYNASDADDPVVIPIVASAEAAGEVVATFSSTVGPMFTMSEVIATAKDGDVTVESDGVRTFVEDQKLAYDDVKTITIEEVSIGALTNRAGDDITATLKGNYVLKTDADGANVTITDKNGLFPNIDLEVVADDEITIDLGAPAANNDGRTAYIVIEGLEIKPTKSCNAGDDAILTFKSKDFDTVKFEVAKMVEEAVTYTVEDDELPVLWAGQLPQNNDDNEGKTLSIFVEENTGDILNTSRKATFTFPEGIEVVDIDHSALDGVETDDAEDYYFEYQIDENVVTIYNYGEDAESNATDMEIAFILSAAPTYTGDVDVTLGGEFDDVSFTVATVKAPYTVEAKTSEVLIDYRYVPVNEIVITEAQEDLLKEGDVIALQVEKMDFEDAGSYEVTSGDIEVDVTINDGNDDIAQLEIEVTDESTEVSTITISGLELYLDRTLPVGGYALENVHSNNILWENSHNAKATTEANGQDDEYLADEDDYTFAENAMYENNNGNVEFVDGFGYEFNGIFKYSAVTVNDSYVEVVTAGRDQDDSSTTRKIVITIGATTMAVGTETVTLDTPAYINAENYTELPLRAVSEAFGATVGWDDASRTVTIMMGQRIVSMTIGSKTMYINGTPVAMNTAPEITNERTFVPVRDLANALGITKIDWNEASATVTLN